jgi:hypothetical protein
MNRTKRHILSLIIFMALLAISTLVVFAKELGLLIISGPGIKGELTLSDPDEMMKLEQSGFFDQSALAKAPAGLGEGYTITAHLNLDGKIVPFVEMVYYPTDEGQPGYVHYIGRLDGETLRKVDEWNILTRASDRAFRSLMTANNITLQSALIKAPAEVAPPEPAAVEPVVVPAASPMPVQPPYGILALVAIILIVAAAGLTLRRRTASHPGTSAGQNL